MMCYFNQTVMGWKQKCAKVQTFWQTIYLFLSDGNRCIETIILNANCKVIVNYEYDMIIG